MLSVIVMNAFQALISNRILKVLLKIQSELSKL